MTTAGNRIYYVYYGTGLGTYENATVDPQFILDNLCPFHAASGNIINPNYHYAAPCDGDTGTADSVDTWLCPRGWGSAYLYHLYAPGCLLGSYYPNSVPSYSGPSPCIGSRLSALITGLVLKFVHFVFFTTMVAAVVSKPLLVLEMNIA